MSRRGFLQATAGMAAGAALGQACRLFGVGTPTAAPQPSPILSTPTFPSEATPPPSPTIMPPSATPESMVGRVALVRTMNRSEGVRRALGLLGINPVQGKRVFLKPNLNSADPAPGSTHDDVLRTLVEILWEMGARSITVGDRSGMGDTRSVMQSKGVFDLGHELGFDTLVFDELTSDGWVRLESPPGSAWQQGFYVARACLEAEAIVQTCNLKTHRFGGHFTLSLKNSVGMAAKSVPGDRHNYMSELHNSPRQRSMIADLNAAYTPALIVLDGVEAFVEGGPEAGTKVQSQVVLAGVDRVAVDAVGVAILRDLGTTPEVRRGLVFEQEQIARAVELGLGATHPEEIAILTEDQEGQVYAERLRRVLTAPGE